MKKGDVGMAKDFSKTKDELSITVNPIIFKSFKVSYLWPYSILASFKVGADLIH